MMKSEILKDILDCDKYKLFIETKDIPNTRILLNVYTRKGQTLFNTETILTLVIDEKEIKFNLPAKTTTYQLLNSSIHYDLK